MIAMVESLPLPWSSCWQPNPDLLKDVGKLLGNRVLLLRLEEKKTESGFELPDTWGKGSILFRCLAVGPGEWFTNPRTKKRKWITPEVKPGEVAVSRHWDQAAQHPGWNEPVYLDYTDGRGRVILDARFCIASWLPE